MISDKNTVQDVRDNTDGYSVYTVTMANGRKEIMTRDCLLHCHLDNANEKCRRVVVKWELDVNSVAPKPHRCDYGETITK